MNLAAGCHSESEKVSSDNYTYEFDPQVIEKLPIYDSLASSILEKFSLFQKIINENDSYRAYKYMPTSKENGVFTKLPEGSALKIDQYYAKLGTKFIFGFDVFKDSTIKIYIRRISSETSQDYVEENLSYYPAENKIWRRDYPDKDTLLNKHWQYWARFKKRGLF